MDRRAEFSEEVRKIVAERAGYQCSVLNCGRLTVGPGPEPTKVVRTGMAAHIYAASPNGPRGTGGLSAAERSGPENGIWCCYTHGKAIDSDSGSAFSAAQLRAWKRLHEARKGAEVIGVPQDRFGLVESILVNSPSVSSSARKFDLGMRNVITGPNESGKTMLARMLASAAYPDHVAELSRHRDVDIEVRWFDPHTHKLATAGRSGNVTHVLDGQPVPYVARPYKVILLDGEKRDTDIGSLVELSHLFDLSSSAMKGVLAALVETSGLVKGVDIIGTHIDWILEVGGRVVRPTARGALAAGISSLILLEIAGIHACHHARVEPTFLIIDELLDFHHGSAQVAALERLDTTAEHAQLAIITHSPIVLEAMSAGWVLTALDSRLPGGVNVRGFPIDFEIEATAAAPAGSEAEQAGDN